MNTAYLVQKFCDLIKFKEYKIYSPIFASAIATANIRYAETLGVIFSGSLKRKIYQIH